MPFVASAHGIKLPETEVPQRVRLVRYAAEFAKERVDAISADGDLAIRAAQKASPSIPIAGVTDDMLGSGFITSFSRPTGNTTGVSILPPELDGKRQDILIEALPGLNHWRFLPISKAQNRHTWMCCERRHAPAI